MNMIMSILKIKLSVLKAWCSRKSGYLEAYFLVILTCIEVCSSCIVLVCFCDESKVTSVDVFIRVRLWNGGNDLAVLGCLQLSRCIAGISERAIKTKAGEWGVGVQTIKAFATSHLTDWRCEELFWEARVWMEIEEHGQISPWLACVFVYFSCTNAHKVSVC